MISSAWAIGCSGLTVTGSTIIPLSDFFTFSTSSACSATARLRWMTPRPPSCAMAMAVRASVTVSIAALSTGMFSRTRRVIGALTSVSRGRISEAAGTSRTSSKVRPSRNSSPSIATPPDVHERHAVN